MKRKEVEDRINARRAAHLTDGPLTRACFDARCDECSRADCTCGCHYPQCPRCGSRSIRLVWAAMYTWDHDSWECLTCDKRWAWM